jgi:hypothetical protein
MRRPRRMPMILIPEVVRQEETCFRVSIMALEPR